MLFYAFKSSFRQYGGKEGKVFRKFSLSLYEWLFASWSCIFIIQGNCKLLCCNLFNNNNNNGRYNNNHHHQYHNNNNNNNHNHNNHNNNNLVIKYNFFLPSKVIKYNGIYYLILLILVFYVITD